MEYVEREQTRQLHHALPRSVLHIVQDAGHMVHLHYADPAVAQVINTLARGFCCRLNSAAVPRRTRSDQQLVRESNCAAGT
jgi:hypothetical protein